MDRGEGDGSQDEKLEKGQHNFAGLGPLGELQVEERTEGRNGVTDYQNTTLTRLHIKLFPFRLPTF